MHRHTALLPLVLAALTMSAHAQDVEPRALELLEHMGGYLATADALSFEAAITYDAVRASGQKLQYSATHRVWMSRPDGFVAELDGDEVRRRVYLDGTRLTVLDLDERVYASTEVPPTIDAALDYFFERHGFSIPIADLLYADPDAVLLENVDTGILVGEHGVGGRPCHHLAFTQETIDWQIWIDAGPQPVPRKLVITFKDELGSPQYSATMSEWDFDPRLATNAFAFTPPSDAAAIEFLPEAPR